MRWFMAEVFNEPDSQTTIDEMVSVALDADPEMLIRQEAEQDWDQAAPHLPDARCPVLVPAKEPTTRRWTSSSAPDLVAALPAAELRWLEGLGHRPDVRRPGPGQPPVARVPLVSQCVPRRLGIHRRSWQRGVVGRAT